MLVLPGMIVNTACVVALGQIGQVAYSASEGSNCEDDPANFPGLEEIQNKILHHCSWCVSMTKSSLRFWVPGCEAVIVDDHMHI